MAYCGKCGTNAEDKKFCPNCGFDMQSKETESMAEKQQSPQNDYAAKIQNLNNTADTTAEYGSKDIADNKIMAVLAYFGILVLIPIFAAKQSEFARYHANQGLVLLFTSIAYSIAYGILSSIIFAISWRLSFILSIFSLVGVVIAILAIMGIINAASGKAKELPIIGKFRILK